MLCVGGGVGEVNTLLLKYNIIEMLNEKIMLCVCVFMCLWNES